MRAALVTASLLALTALHCTRTPPVASPPTTSAPTAAPPLAAAPARAPRAPEADPAEFRTATRELDVDGDGLLDRVRSLPALTPPGERGDYLVSAPPTLVAHRLADGRFATDDELTRALLLAACPEARRPPPALGSGGASNQPSDILSGLFWTGFCVRAWGGTADDAERALRAFAQTPAAGAGATAHADLAVAAVREAVLPITLAAGEVETLRAWRPTPDPQTPPPEVPPAAAPAVDPRCAPLNARNRLRVAPANRLALAYQTAHTDGMTPSGLNLDAPIRMCEATTAGLWSLALAPARFVPGEEASITAAATLTWTPTRGRALTLAPPIVCTIQSMSTVQPTLDAAFDWDGDGVPEVVVRENHWVHESSEESPVRLYTVRDGAVRAYAPAQGFPHILTIEDIDHDGRPDLVLPSPWRHVDNCGLDGIPHEGPTLVAHALADGTFTVRDDVARAWVMRQCARAEHDRRGAAVDVVDIACARAWGQSPEAVVRAARPLVLDVRQRDGERAATEEGCMGFHAMAAVAAVAPPFEALREGLAPIAPAASH